MDGLIIFMFAMSLIGGLFHLGLLAAVVTCVIAVNAYEVRAEMMRIELHEDERRHQWRLELYDKQIEWEKTIGGK